MPLFFLLFLLGVVCSLLVKQIPSLLFLTLSILLCLLPICAQLKMVKHLAAAGLGCSWAVLHAYFITAWSLPSAIENRPVMLQGYVASIPTQQERSVQLVLRVTTIETEKTAQFKVQLVWRHASCLPKVGEYWRFKARLRKPHALMDPGAFDVEKYYFQHHLRAVGVIVPDQANVRLLTAGRHYPIQQLRAHLLDKAMQKFAAEPLCGIIIALALGLTHFITQAQWQVFRVTGTNHLVAISGLHIGLVSALVVKLVSRLWGWIPGGPLWLPTPHVSALAGLGAALLYSVIAGLSPSTTRSLVMISSWVLATLLQRRVTTFRSLTLALGVILIFNPFAVLSVGFWLSFIAVFLLIYGLQGRLMQKGLWWSWGRAQWVITLGMMPTLLLIYQQASFISVPANIIAIPWISFVVVPVCLVGFAMLVFSEKLGYLLLQLSIYLLQLVWWYLAWLSHYTCFIWHYAFQSSLSLGITHVAGLMSLVPKGLLHSYLAIFYWLPCLVPAASTSGKALQLVVFDVGQGLATLVRTAHHVMVFDTGVKRNEYMDMGKAVILPYLARHGINHIDLLTVSHGDNDHIGGAAALIDSMQVQHIITGVPERFKYLRAQTKSKIVIEPCVENRSWQWDGVQFKFLSPPKHASFTGNNASCVLKITQGTTSILMTGDIEQGAESELLRRHAQELPATILLAPHHGSKTSSSRLFLQRVLPSYVIFSCGYLNSYHHPHREVIQRYKELKTRLLSTVSSGAILMTLRRDSAMVTVEEYGKTHQRIWHH